MAYSERYSQIRQVKDEMRAKIEELEENPYDIEDAKEFITDLLNKRLLANIKQENWEPIGDGKWMVDDIAEPIRDDFRGTRYGRRLGKDEIVNSILFVPKSFGLTLFTCDQFVKGTNDINEIDIDRLVDWSKSPTKGANF